MNFPNLEKCIDQFLHPIIIEYNENGMIQNENSTSAKQMKVFQIGNFK